MALESRIVASIRRNSDVVNSRIDNDVNQNTFQLEAARPKRKYTKRKDREAAAAAEGVMLGPDGKKLPKAARALSPLTQVR